MPGPALLRSPRSCCASITWSSTRSRRTCASATGRNSSANCGTALRHAYAWARRTARARPRPRRGHGVAAMICSDQLGAHPRRRPRAPPPCADPRPPPAQRRQRLEVSDSRANASSNSGSCCRFTSCSVIRTSRVWPASPPPRSRRGSARSVHHLCGQQGHDALLDLRDRSALAQPS